jgi:hypothetical protein
VGVAAVIAGNCRVPLTAILLLFELTRDYTIILPTLGAVGLSYWVSIALEPAAKKGPKEGGNATKPAGKPSVPSDMGVRQDSNSMASSSDRPASPTSSLPR